MAIVGGYLSKRFGAARMMPIYMLGWGTMAALVRTFPTKQSSMLTVLPAECDRP